MLPTTRLLIVDDNETDQVLFRRALRSTGYDLIVASSGHEGLALAIEARPNLILLDHNLPDINGIEFLKRISEESDVAIPIIMLTGEGNEQVAVQAMKGGANDYLVKDTAGQYLKLLPSVFERSLAVHEERIRARRLVALHDAILRTVADGIIGIDADGVILFANPAASRMLLCPVQDLIGSMVADFLLLADGPLQWDSHPLAQPHDGTVTLCRDSDFLRRRSGTSFPVAYTASALEFEGSCRFGWVLVFQDITERVKAVEELIQTARYDTLTGLPNRVMFQDYLGKALARADRSQRSLAVMFLDLDGFKAVNDNFGHQAGDQLLQLVAQRLVNCVRVGDLVSRLGGDEFTLVIEDGETAHLETVARKILQAIEKPYDLGFHQAHVSTSIGIAIYPECGSDVQSLLQKADGAMYKIKKSGKKGYAFCHREVVS